MAKKIVGFIKLQIPAGKANPSPPVGPALGQRGLNIMEFCKAFNAQTSGMEPGLMLPVVITAFADKSFTFVLKSPPATVEALSYNCYKNPRLDNREVCGGDAEATIKRSDFGMSYGIPFIPDEIKLVIQIEAIKQ